VTHTHSGCPLGAPGRRRRRDRGAARERAIEDGELVAARIGRYVPRAVRRGAGRLGPRRRPDGCCASRGRGTPDILIWSGEDARRASYASRTSRRPPRHHGRAAVRDRLDQQRLGSLVDRGDVPTACAASACDRRRRADEDRLAGLRVATTFAVRHRRRTWAPPQSPWRWVRACCAATTATPSLPHASQYRREIRRQTDV
jgi:hypothetical protein